MQGEETTIHCATAWLDEFSVRLLKHGNGRPHPNCGLMLLYDVIRWWTLWVQAFKYWTETIKASILSVTCFFLLVLRSNWFWCSIECERRWEFFPRCLFPIECDWGQDHPWQILMKNQLIDEMRCYRFPGLHVWCATEARQWWRLFPNLIVFIDTTSDKEKKTTRTISTAFRRPIF